MLVAALAALVASAGCLDSAASPGIVSQDATADAPADPGTLADAPQPDQPAADADPTDCADGGFWMASWGECLPRECGPGELFFWDIQACIPTDWLGCREAAQCDPDDATTCDAAAGEICHPWAATWFPISAQALPACLPGPAMQFPTGTLRIHPTHGPAGQSTMVTIEGGALYVGALVWRYRYGTAGIYEVAGGPDACVSLAELGLPEPRVYPVEVAYGFGDLAWSLAGFFTATDGATPDPPAGQQPGQVCAAASDCLEAYPWQCGCVDGRCRCATEP